MEDQVAVVDGVAVDVPGVVLVLLKFAMITPGPVIVAVVEADVGERIVIWPTDVQALKV